MHALTDSLTTQTKRTSLSFKKAIDIWMGACTGFIFAALLEFTLTNYLWRKGHKGGMPYISRKRMKGFVPAAAAAATAATTFDPSMFATMMGAPEAAAAAAALATSNSGACKLNLEDDQVPLTSPAHNLLKRKNRHGDSNNLYSSEGSRYVSCL